MVTPACSTGHIDTFVADHLPADESLAEFLWDHPDLQYPARLNCAVELLDAAVAGGNGSGRCLVDSGGASWTYAEVLSWSNQIANVLVDEHGLVSGNRVLLRGPNSPWLAACWLAVQKAGLIAVATMPMLRAGELGTIIARAHVDLSLCDSRYLDELVAASPDGPPIVAYGDGTELATAIESASASFANCDTAGTDVSLIAFTSGTTGEPKGCVHLHRDVLAVADTFSRHILAPSNHDVFIGSPPLAFTFGLGGLLVFPMRAGACSVLLESAAPAVLLAAIAQHQATIVFTAPTAFRVMIDLIPDHDLTSLSKAVSAGEPLQLSTRTRFESATGIRMIDGLGATEMLHVVLSAAGDDIRPGAVGRPVPGFEARIVDANGNEVPSGEIGRLAVKGPTGCRYLADPRQSEYVQNGWNFTGDSMWRDDDGYFWYAARADDMIISAGYNISGPEVEGAILTHDGVAECACVGVPDDERGMIVKAFVVPKDPTFATDVFAKELQDHVKQSIAPYKYPRLVEFRTELPKSITGKLQRFKLRAGQ